MPKIAAPDNTPAPGWQGGVHGLFDKLEEGVKTAAGNVGESIMPTPTALKGLLSSDDVATARRQGLLSLGIALSQGRGENPLQSLGRGLQAAQQGFKDHLSDVVQQKQLAETEQMRQATLAQQQRLLTSRAQIAQQFLAPSTPESPQQTEARLRGMAMAYTNSNDPDMAAKIGSIIKDIRAPEGIHTINAGDRQITVGPDGKTIRVDPVTENPAQVARDRIAQQRADAVDARMNANESKAEALQRQQTIRQQNVIVHDFNKTAEDYHAAEAGYAVLKAAKASPNNFMQPMAALDALARMLNPKGAVRQGTLQILKSQGSLGDRLERNLTMLKSGKWPEGMQQEVFGMADKIMSEHTQDFETARQEAIDRGDAQGVDVRPLLHKSQPIKAPTAADTGPYGKRPK